MTSPCDLNVIWTALLIYAACTLNLLRCNIPMEEYPMTRMIGNALLAGGIGLALACAGGAANAQQVFTLSSTTFKDGAMLPAKAANSKANAPNNANCVGDNVSPQLS